jgi:hypothetical protein
MNSHSTCLSCIRVTGRASHPLGAGHKAGARMVITLEYEP